MVTRLGMVVLILLAASSACAESLTPDAARRFVAGKLFAFNCFDGSRGAGRIYGDGSVIGTIQFRGAGAARTVSLPATAASAARGWVLPIATSRALRRRRPADPLSL